MIYKEKPGAALDWIPGAHATPNKNKFKKLASIAFEIENFTLSDLICFSFLLAWLTFKS